MISGSALSKLKEKAGGLKGLSNLNMGIEGWASGSGEEVLESGDENEKVPPSKKTDKNVADMLQYLMSPVYKQRLVKMGVKNPDEIIKGRTERLKKTVFKEGPQSKMTSEYTAEGEEIPTVVVNPKENKYVKAHELGHVVGGGSQYKVEAFNEATPEQLSPKETWMFYNRNNWLQGLDKRPSEVDKGKTRLDTMWNEAVTTDGGATKFQKGYPDPALDAFGVFNQHDASSTENYGDLNAIRQILLDKGITTQFGEQLTPEKWQKVLADKNLLNQEHIKRLRKNFSDEAIIQLNNTIAKGGGQKMQTIA